MNSVRCPFCRELFAREIALCPLCTLPLEPCDLSRISVEPDEEEALSLFDIRCGRPLLLLLALAGIALFFCPWIHLTLPDAVDFSGFDLARRIRWCWAGGIAWLILIPTIMSRKSLPQLRSARFAAFFLSFIPALTGLILLARPPKGGVVHIHFAYAWPFWIALAFSLLACAQSIRLGKIHKNPSPRS